MSDRSQRTRNLKRRKLYEDAATGGIRHIGHLPIYSDHIQGWTIQRCACGFVLFMSTTRRVYWARASASVREIESMQDLLHALSCRCRAHPPSAVPVAAPAPPPVTVKPPAAIGTPIPAPPAVAVKPLATVKPRVCLDHIPATPRWTKKVTSKKERVTTYGNETRQPLHDRR